MSAPITRLTSVVTPLLRDDINTDVIIPSREMKLVSRKGLADGLFADWRYTKVGGREPEPGFVLNDPAYSGSCILAVGANFGCGSSREHAAWALQEFGIRAILAKSFNPIFRGNAVLNGIVPVVLPGDAVDALAAQCIADPATVASIDLDMMQVVAPGGTVLPFDLDPEARKMLREGLDAIDLTLLREAEIRAFRDADRLARPWAYQPAA